MIESRNYRLRPIEISDRDFVIETMLDFPVTTMTYASAMNEFSNMEYVSRGFREEDVMTHTEVTMILEHAGVPVGLRVSRFTEGVVEIAIVARHPSHRGADHGKADNFLHGWWYFEALNCTSCWFETIDDVSVNSLVSKWREKAVTEEWTRPSRFDKENTLRSGTILPDEYRELKAESPEWKQEITEQTAPIRRGSGVSINKPNPASS